MNSFDVNVLSWEVTHLCSMRTLFFRHYFQKVCNYWSKQGKFTPDKVNAIMNQRENAYASSAWLLLSEISSSKPKLDPQKIIDCCVKYMADGMWFVFKRERYLVDFGILTNFFHYRQRQIAL